MRAKVFGFVWDPSPGVPLAAVMDLIDGLGTDLQKIGRGERLVAIHEGEDRYYGMIVSSKNRKVLTFIQKSGKTWQAVRQQLGKNRNQMEFNFFAIMKDTGKGVYISYPESCSLWTISNFAKKLHNKHARSEKRAEKDAAGRMTRAELATLKKKYRDFKWRYVMNRETWDQILAQAQALKKIRYKIAYPKADQMLAVVPGKVKLQSAALSFEQDLKPTSEVIDDIKSFLHTEGLKDVDIEAEFEDSIVETIHLLSDNKENCGVYDLDALSELVDMKDIFTEFSESKIIGLLDEVIEENEHWL